MATRPLTARFSIASLCAALLIGGAACESLTGAAKGVHTVAINTPVDGSVSGTTTDQYEFRLTESTQFMVLFQVISGSAVLDLELEPSTHLSTLNQSDPGEPLGRNFTAVFVAVPMGVYRIQVHGDGQYRFEVYSSAPTPEHASANIAIGDTVATEDIHAPSDVDVFHFTGAAGDELIGYLTANQPHSGVVHLTVTGPAGDNTVLATVSSFGGTPFESDASARFVLPAAGVYTATVSAVDPNSEINDFSGPYTFQIRRIDRNPEHGPVALVPNVAVTGESLDYIGDIDEFTLAGTPGDVYILRLLATHGESSAFLLETTGILLQDTEQLERPITLLSRGTDTVLTDQSTFRFHLPASGHTTVRVSAANQPGGRLPVSKGSYIVRADRINRAPEVASPFLTVGDSVTNERMDPTGEIDEYTVTVTKTESINFVLRIDSAAYYSHPGPKTILTADQSTLAGDPRGGTSGACSALPLIRSSGTFSIDPGQYLMRVSDQLFGITGFAGYAGPYTLTINRIDPGPEMGPSVVAIGDTVHDALFPIGDFDNYTFAGVQGDAVEFQIQGLGPASSPTELQYALFGPTGFDPLVRGFVATPTAQLSDNTTGLMVLPATGTYRILIFDGGEGDNPCGQGPYRFALVRPGTSPEVHGSSLAVGDIVSDEALDNPSDIDEFTLHGVPGTEVAIFVRTVGVLPHILVEALMSTTRDTIRTAAGSQGTTGRFLIPPSGDLLLRVFDTNHETGAYQLQIFPINRAPEHTSASYTLGTVAPDETIDANGADIDEYHFTGVAGQKVDGFLQTPTGVGFPGVMLEVLTPGALQALGLVSIVNPSPNLQDNSTGVFTLPVSGQYVIRVQGVSDRGSVGTYRFLVQVVP